MGFARVLQGETKRQREREREGQRERDLSAPRLLSASGRLRKVPAVDDCPPHTTAERTAPKPSASAMPWERPDGIAIAVRPLPRWLVRACWAHACRIDPTSGITRSLEARRDESNDTDEARRPAARTIERARRGLAIQRKGASGFLLRCCCFSARGSRTQGRIPRGI